MANALGLEHEKAYYAQRCALTGAQYAALAATPLYALNALRRGTFSIRSLTRLNWTLPLVGAGGGYATALGITSQESSAATASRTFTLRRDANLVRKDDFYLVGAAVGGLLTPALFLGRAGLINGLLGGTGLGGATGLLMYYAETEDKDSILGMAKRAIGQGEAVAKDAEKKGKQLASDAQAKGREVIEKRS